jgi:succinoglycan biosynthesis protein ExoM
MDDRVTVDIGLPTFRRDSVAQTIASLGRQHLPPHVRIRVIVADNEPLPAAEGRVRAAAFAAKLDLFYVHAPAQNICIARNAILDAARADFLAFIDDDEEAGPDWVAALLRAIETTGADAVQGPVVAIYPPNTPAWIKAGDYHSVRPVKVRGKILKGYAGNCLIRTQAIHRHGLRFDPSLGRIGGEDDDFFYQLTDRGGVIMEAEDAPLHELVPPSRANFGWLIKRSFRSGQTHGRRLLRRALPRRIAELGLAGAKSGACLLGAAANALFPARRRKWLVRGALHAGAVARLAGIKELQMY